MQGIGELLGNQWFVGISGGLLSGFIVAVISRLILSPRDEKAYVQKVGTANREVLYAIRPETPEEALPKNDVLKSLIAATARKYDVNKNDMYNLTDISSELIKEVMDSNFISSPLKREFCEKLSQIKEEPTLQEKEKVAVDARYQLFIGYRRRIVAMLGITVAILTASALIITEPLKEGNVKIETLSFILLLPIILTSLLLVLSNRIRRLKVQSQLLDRLVKKAKKREK